MRTVRDATVPPVRRAGRALPRPTGSLLSPRLLVTARDFAAGQRIARALALIRQERDDRAMQHVLVHRAVEQRLGERDRFLARARRRVVKSLNHGDSALPA